MAGRTGNDIASAFRRILDVLVEENDITECVTWSDSCVPQNRNSIISNAVLEFLRDNKAVTSFTMKYSLPGHSCVQVESIPSCIEKAMNNSDFYSPIDLIRILKLINRHNPYRIIQMKPSDFKNFVETAKLLNYKAVPFTQVSSLRFNRTFHTLYHKTSHDPCEPENCKCIKLGETPKRKCKKESPSTSTSSENVFYVKPKTQKYAVEMSELKKKDIKAAFPFTPLQDREYYLAVFK